MLLWRHINKSNIVRQVCAVHEPLAGVRHFRKNRWLRPGEARSLAERLALWNRPDPVLDKRIDIGFPEIAADVSGQLQNRVQSLRSRRHNVEMERIARSNKLLVDLEQVHKDGQSAGYEKRLSQMADHYGVFEHLFGKAFFAPRVPLDISYPIDEETANPVYSGNMLKPAEVTKAPVVSFNGRINPITGGQSEQDSYWTLIATNPDAHCNEAESEYVHWFIANIPNGDIAAGEQLVDYLQPFPARGLGYQRFVFVLYKQDAKMDFSEYKLSVADYANLAKRTFKTLDFYRKHQHDITPAGLAFFQTDWDTTLTDFYHNVLNMKEPIYEYDFPKSYVTPQRYFPLKQPFNIYLDRYRDIHKVNADYVNRLLNKTHPFKGPKPPLKYPNAQPIKGVPSWLKDQMQMDRLRLGRILDY